MHCSSVVLERTHVKFANKKGMGITTTENWNTNVHMEVPMPTHIPQKELLLAEHLERPHMLLLCNGSDCNMCSLDNIKS